MKKRVISVTLASALLIQSGIIVYKRYFFNKENISFDDEKKYEQTIQAPEITSVPIVQETITPTPTKVATPTPTPELTPEVVYVNEIAYMKYATNLYDDNFNVITTTNDYQKCIIHSYLNNMVLIEDEFGNIGYVENNAVAILPGTYIEIDISSQTLNLYQNYELTFSTPVVTGKPTTPTYEGYFQIAYKCTDTVLQGTDYYCPVNYWMPFNGGIGIHDALWRNQSDFTDPNTYTYNGSHGCVNLPSKEVAKIIYDAVYTNNPDYYTIGENNTRVLVHD